MTKSFEALNNGLVYISSCDFSEVDLTFNDLSKNISFIRIFDSNVSNTGLVIPMNIEILFFKSNLSNLDLSNFTINGNNYLNNDGDGENFERCNLTNTGISIIFNGEEYKKLLDSDYQTYKDLINKTMLASWTGVV